ncbi:MAG: tRNA epoxyqueuosine(34) reductase QueG [Bacteroidia bacterium]|nr:tRNA epoxyqueuosine(34) reductase QueG [Bacteroidia bacterium]MDW8134168.1 tRNA epoxyqueuosine(34) reductase QueG [Bacteroidia bacterium]
MDIALTQAIKALIQGLGFDACGVAQVKPLSSTTDDTNPPSPAQIAYQRYLNWIAAGKQAKMDYLAKTTHLRGNPLSLLPDARSIIVVLQNYFHTRKRVSHIAQYAWGRDYHEHMRYRLQIVADYLVRKGYSARIFADTAPILEKAWAVEAGLGWIGKNTLLINRRLGSYTFIGGIITAANLLVDKPFLEDYCGTCQKCIEACPTQALSPYELDARRCIAYWTIEAPEMQEESTSTHGWLFGCDICQQVCPWNRFARPQGEIALRPRPSTFWTSQQWKRLSNSQLKKVQERSALRRARPQKLKAIAQLLTSKQERSIIPLVNHPFNS